MLDKILPAKWLKISPLPGNEHVLRAPLATNLNDKGVFFAGSIYSLAVLTGYQAVSVQAKEHNLSGELYIASSTIEFLKPIASDATAICREIGGFSETKSGNRKLTLEVVVMDDHQDVCAKFGGTYVLKQT